MSIRDLALTLTASILIGAFLIPTLINTKKFDAIPNSYAVLFIGLPALALIGMFVIKQLSKKLALLWQVAKFALVGVLNTAIDFGILNLLILITGFTAGAGIGIINIPSFTLAILNSYIWNRKWVFENAKQGNFFVLHDCCSCSNYLDSPTFWTLAYSLGKCSQGLCNRILDGLEFHRV